MKMERYLVGIALSALVAGFALPTAASAQSTDSEPTDATVEPSDIAVEDAGQSEANVIVVTARRRDEDIQDVPISVTAISGDSLARLGVSDINAVQALVPSLSITNSGTTRDAFVLAIRGQRTNEIQLLTDPPVGTYFAEVVQPRPFGFGNALYDIASIQVLKGVQGTLFGRNVTGGAVLVEPNRPNTEKFGVEVVGQIGNYDMHDVYGMINVPVGEWAAVRIAGKTRRRDGFVIDQSNGRDYDDQSYDTFRASILIEPTDWLESITIGDWYRSRQHGSAVIPDFISLFNTTTGQPTVLGRLEGTRAAGAAGLAGPASPLLANLPNIPAQFAAIQAGRRDNFYSFNTAIGDGGRLDVGGGTLPYANLDNKGVTNRTTIDFGFARVKNIFGYREIDFDRYFDLDGFPAFLLEPLQFTHIKQYSNELQLQGDVGRLNYTVGAFYFRESGLDGSQTAQFPELSLLGFANSGIPINPFTEPALTALNRSESGGRSTSYAGYAAATYELTDELTLAGGIRYNHDKREITTSGIFPNLLGGSCTLDLNDDGRPDPLTPANCTVSRSKSFDAITWDLTLQYEPSPELTTYISTRKGYRAGGFNLRATSNTSLTPFEPEKVQEYEVGLKTNNRIGPARLTTSFAIFYQDYSNVQKQQVMTVNGVIQTVVTNTTKQRNYGGEAEASIRFDQGLSIGLFYSNVNAEILEGGNGSFVLIGSPKHQIGVNVGFEREIGSLGTLQLNSNLSFKSEQFLDDLDIQGRQKPYALVNLRAGIQNIGGSGFGAAVFANNVFDEKYRLGVVGLLADVGYHSSIYGEPRMYGAEVSFRF